MANNMQKLVTLSPDTHKIASKMDNFSGWLRARLRQYDEGIDLVELDTMKEWHKKKFSTLSAAIAEQNDEIMDDIWHLYNELLQQSKLGDFEWVPRSLDVLVMSANKYRCADMLNICVGEHE